MTKYINYALILFAFSLPFKLFFLNVLPPVIFLMWIVEGNLEKKWQILKKQKIFWLVMGISLIVLLSFLWSDSLYEGYFGSRTDFGLKYWFGKYSYKFLLFPVLLTHVNEKLFKTMISAFLAAMFISEIISYGIFFEFWSVGRGTPQDPTPFLHHTYYSIFLVLAIFILLIRFSKEKNQALKLFYLLFALSATINLFLNGGRTGQFAFILSSLYFALHHYRLNLKTVIATLGALVLIYFLAYNISPVFKQRMDYTKESLQKLSNNQLQTSFGQRVAIWIAALEVIKEHPLLGAGTGSAKSAIAQVQKSQFPSRPYIQELPHLHNQFFQAYLNSGIVGFLLFGALFYLLWSEKFYTFDPYAKIFGITLLILFLTDTPFHFSIGVNYTLFFLGIFFGYKRYYEEKVAL